MNRKDSIFKQFRTSAKQFRTYLELQRGCKNLEFCNIRKQKMKNLVILNHVIETFNLFFSTIKRMYDKHR